MLVFPRRKSGFFFQLDLYTCILDFFYFPRKAKEGCDPDVDLIEDDEIGTRFKRPRGAAPWEIWRYDSEESDKLSLSKASGRAVGSPLLVLDVILIVNVTHSPPPHDDSLLVGLVNDL